MRFLLLLVLPVLIANISLAQQSMLAGKIVGKDNAPIAGAKIEMKRGYKVAESKSDCDGLFYSKLLPVGYYHIKVVAGGKQMKVKSVYLPDETKKKSFYYLKVVNDKVIVTMDAEDPFLKAKLTKIESEDPYKTLFREGAVYHFEFKTDKVTGKQKGSVKIVSGNPSPPLRMKDVH